MGPFLVVINPVLFDKMKPFNGHSAQDHDLPEADRLVIKHQNTPTTDGGTIYTTCIMIYPWCMHVTCKLKYQCNVQPLVCMCSSRVYITSTTLTTLVGHVSGSIAQDQSCCYPLVTWYNVSYCSYM